MGSFNPSLRQRLSYVTLQQRFPIFMHKCMSFSIRNQFFKKAKKANVKICSRNQSALKQLVNILLFMRIRIRSRTCHNPITGMADTQKYPLSPYLCIHTPSNPLREKEKTLLLLLYSYSTWTSVLCPVSMHANCILKISLQNHQWELEHLFWHA